VPHRDPQKDLLAQLKRQTDELRRLRNKTERLLQKTETITERVRYRSKTLSPRKR
jgi:hypothetical protein